MEARSLRSDVQGLADHHWRKPGHTPWQHGPSSGVPRSAARRISYVATLFGAWRLTLPFSGFVG